jgi:hypothetical protein
MGCLECTGTALQSASGAWSTGVGTDGLVRTSASADTALMLSSTSWWTDNTKGNGVSTEAGASRLGSAPAEQDAWPRSGSDLLLPAPPALQTVWPPSHRPPAPVLSLDVRSKVPVALPTALEVFKRMNPEIGAGGVERLPDLHKLLSVFDTGYEMMRTSTRAMHAQLGASPQEIDEKERVRESMTSWLSLRDDVAVPCKRRTPHCQGLQDLEVGAALTEITRMWRQTSAPSLRILGSGSLPALPPSVCCFPRCSGHGCSYYGVGSWISVGCGMIMKSYLRTCPTCSSGHQSYGQPSACRLGSFARTCW